MARKKVTTKQENGGDAKGSSNHHESNGKVSDLEALTLLYAQTIEERILKTVHQLYTGQTQSQQKTLNEFALNTIAATVNLEGEICPPRYEY